MNNSPITGIFLRTYGYERKFVVKREIGPFHYQYDVYRPWDKIDIVRDLVKKHQRQCTMLESRAVSTGRRGCNNAFY